ncbi:hypothetical protein D6T64_21595 [Cryobacterium melibiosiphilum]|uniref:DUF3828 domain-containing protein n=1 Tax=Cryobacterium melibiosiphilum TaxID=995039 RepID=A0A3A5MH74_9MICO|nr:hypothetical protein [Cryobacterium melibiosiphilum]RJT84741.1 hypothetical protein D6T64_21595 [Cryobacterium melibiosiphilum]
MTTYTSRSPRASRRLALIGLFSVGLLGVTACTAGESAPTASPEASVTPTPEALATGESAPPTSYEDAMTNSTAAAQEYLRVWAEIEVENPADSSAIDDVAIEQAARHVHELSERQASDGLVATGASSYQVLPESTVGEYSLGETSLPFSAATLVGCFDTSGSNFTHADGSVVQMQPIRSGLIRMVLVYLESEQRWMVKDFIDPDVVEPC